MCVEVFHNEVNLHDKIIHYFKNTQSRSSPVFPVLTFDLAFQGICRGNGIPERFYVLKAPESLSFFSNGPSRLKVCRPSFLRWFCEVPFNHFHKYTFGERVAQSKKLDKSWSLIIILHDNVAQFIFKDFLRRTNTVANGFRGIWNTWLDVRWNGIECKVGWAKGQQHGGHKLVLQSHEAQVPVIAVSVTTQPMEKSPTLSELSVSYRWNRSNSTMSFTGLLWRVKLCLTPTKHSVNAYHLFSQLGKYKKQWKKANKQPRPYQ